MKKPFLFVIAAFAAGQVCAADLNTLTAADMAAVPPDAINMPADPIETKANTLPQALRKIKLNSADENTNDRLVGLLRDGLDMDWVLDDMASMGFKASVRPEASGGHSVVVDVKGLDESDYAIGLARVYYVTEVRVGRAIYEEIFGAGAKSTYAVRQGTIKGGMNGSPVDIKIDKVLWTIKGGMNHSPVDIAIDHEARTITGGANLSPVDLRFEWSKEKVLVEGGANHSPIRYLADWKSGELTGYANNAPLKLEFDMQEGEAGSMIVKVSGYANRAPVELVYNKHNGHIGGGMNRSQVDVTLVNCDLYDFLQYFFLFAGKN